MENVTTSEPESEVSFENLDQSANHLVAEPFDLSKGPLYRIQLQRFATDHHALIIVLHHLIADGWSRGVLMRDLSRHYSAFASNVTPKLSRDGDDLSRLARAVHQSDQQWHASQEFKQQLDFWRDQLAGFRKLELPFAKLPTPTIDSAGRIQTRTLPKFLSESIAALAKQQSATLFMTLLTAFDVLLFKYTGIRDLAVGVPVAGRRHPECQDLIGYFVNTIVMRTQFQDDPEATFVDWLEQTKTTVLSGLAHQHVPMADVIKACAPRDGRPEISESSDGSRNLGNPLFEIMFQLQSDGYRTQNSATPDVAFPGLTLTQRHLDLPETKFDLTWHMFDRDDGLLIAAEYRTSMISEGQMERMLDHFETMLNGIIADPQQRITDVSIMKDSERASWLAASSSAFASLSSEHQRYDEAFACAVRAQPNGIAVRFGGQEITFEELDTQATDLAAKLLELGVHSNDIIGIELSRCVDQLVAVLAVMKSGAAYLPLDTQLPPSRLEFMRHDAGCRWWIDRDGIQSIRVEDSSSFYSPAEREDRALRPGEGRLQPSPALGGRLSQRESEEDRRDLAYVIYTSGSTGQPKGTMVTHSGLMNYLDWALATYPYESGWGCPVQSSFAFDATITSMLAPLLVGKTVHLLPEQNELEELANVVQTGTSVVKLTPAHLAAIEPLLPTDLLADEMPSALVIGGEALTAEHVRWWREYYPSVRLFNEYGPTETVVGCCVHEVDQATRTHGNLPIGKPIAGTQLYVLDESLNPAPFGVPGELYIAGHGVSLGYLGKPSLTAERFLPNPFAWETNSQKNKTLNLSDSAIYRSGDFACLRDDGVFEYLGRHDDQIQIRGYRVELAEVDATIRRQDNVQQCAVRMDSGKIVAFIQPRHGNIDSVEVQRKLRQELPSYMVPAVIEKVDQIKLTANGKVDLRSLPNIQTLKLSGPRSFVAARNKVEEQLLTIWREVLGRSDFGVEDNFFELGGDSISAMRIIAGVRRLGFQLAPAQLFENQTVAAQSLIIEAAEVISSASGEQGPSEEDTSGEVPLTPLQADFFAGNPPNPHHFNQGFLLCISSEFDFGRFEKAMWHTIAQHDSFRLRFRQAKSGHWCQHYVPADQIGNQIAIIEEVDLSNTTDFDEALRREISRRQRGFDLANGPLFRATVFRGPANPSSLSPALGGRLSQREKELGINGNDRLLLLAHHLIIDGVSWRVLIDDVLNLYGETSTDFESSLPKSDSFGRWARRRFGALANTKQTQQKVSQLWKDADTRLTSRDQDAGIDEALLLTALAQTLRQFHRIDLIDIDFEHHGRDIKNDQIDLSRTVGWFTSVAKLSLKLPDAAFETQVRYVRDELEQSRSQVNLEPPADTSFNYLGHLVVPPARGVVGLAGEIIADLNAPDNPRRNALDVIVWQTGSMLQVLWRFDLQAYSGQVIDRLAQRYLSAIDSLLNAGQTSAKSSHQTVNPEYGDLMAKLQSLGS
ncbi:MAG: amino acid adenylation domain-containing protein [Planctomycetota bacterium]